MTDLHAELRELQNTCAAQAECIMANNAERQDWQRELLSLRADAERYRWLRDVHDYHYTVTRYVGGATIPRFHGEQLDVAIDAAMREKT